VSVVIVVRNEAAQITEKVRNTLALDYPPDRCEIIVFSDGSTDGTEQRISSLADHRIQVLSHPRHEGKNPSLNKAVQQSSGEILCFTDVDATIAPEALLKLVRHFGDPGVGGVCGDKIVAKDRKGIEEAQVVYARFARAIKEAESRLGSISSNDGTLYAIRRALFQPIPPAVTDDLYVCMSVVRQGFRFLFDREAKAHIHASSRNPRHELERRRRIVSTSLRGIVYMRAVLNPFRYGFFSVGLWINKVMRRLLPVLLIVLFLSTLWLSADSSLMKGMFILQLLFYFAAFLHWTVGRHVHLPGVAGKAGSVAFYFCLGNYGTLLGLADLLRGRKTSKWDP
jgi:cellulose synthase/poly-beta-1,6-N-acetylglucosamine synthase-like glycosyltransferase